MLTLSHISKTFNPGTINEKSALHDLSLHLDKGEFVTTIGSNGAGKSTLFNIISGSFYVDSGSIEIAGREVTLLSEHRRAKHIGRLFQDPLAGTAPNMTIEENLTLAAGTGGWFSSLKRSDRENLRARLALLGMGLEDRMKQPVGLLSGGQRQALTLLMSTMAPPWLLLLDEHTAALDPSTAEKVLTLTEQITQEDHITTLMITHNLQNALALGTRTLMMDSGRIVLDVSGEERQSLTPQDLLTRFQSQAGKPLDNDRVVFSQTPPSS